MGINRKKTSTLKKAINAIGWSFFALYTIARCKRDDSNYVHEPEERNPLEGKRVVFVENDEEPENADGARGHLEAVGIAEIKQSGYQRFIKRAIDVALSFMGLMLLSPILGIIALFIVIDDPGPVLFTQKRIGQNKKYFKLHKFRSMKMSTPHDVPTHMLDNPEQYITRVGRFLRAHSLDELPQVWDIFIGNMSIIGPRPGLWNQDVLTSERERYGANEIKPGLTGWAQINGRDELEIPIKAGYDGEYAETIRKGGLPAFLFDCKCFIGTVFSVARGDGIVEGSTRALKGNRRYGVPENNPVTPLGCDLDLHPDISAERRVLITGAGSYIGESVVRYAKENYPKIHIATLDMIDGSWRMYDFRGFDSVYHVAGIAHADVGNVSEEVKEKYYKINTDLAIEVAEKAKSAGVKQFIFMSSMIVYGNSAPVGVSKRISRYTVPEPDNYYGDSKWQAEKGVRALADDKFKVAVLRPPMIYGKGSKGNYPTLAKMAKGLPLFPDIDNERSMLYIENLCEFICKLLQCGEGGLYFPQNSNYVRTSDMVREVAKTVDHRIIVNKIFNPAVLCAAKLPGKIGSLANKAFGNFSYEQELSAYSFEYRKEELAGSIAKTEGTGETKPQKQHNKLQNLKGKRVLLIALPGYPDGIVKQMQEMGADVDYINDKPNDGFLCKTLGRLQVGAYQKVINKYYSEKIAELEDRNYDFVLAIRGEYTPKEALQLIRQTFPNAKLILYMWDGLHKTNTRGIEEKWSYYDQVYTFDRIDYEANKGKIEFLPLFYYNSYLPEFFDYSDESSFDYDLSFIGTGHGDRIKIVKQIMGQCLNNGKRCFSYFFLPHKFVFVKDKLLNRNFDEVDLQDVHFEMMPFADLYEIYSRSRCIVDVENAGQHGLTMRSIEVLGLKRKFITTNMDIIHYDFYDKDNIFVIDRDNPVIDMSFFDRPYRELSQEIYEKYSLKNWILEVLK